MTNSTFSFFIQGQTKQKRSGIDPSEFGSSLRELYIRSKEKLMQAKEATVIVPTLMDLGQSTEIYSALILSIQRV